mmetsp:Transcript_17273/g.41597  ORF Transcript_17273/g.41597 Transcript_17273/m.41597 type:complete len:244 (+) Transcript_17273:1071-1802(+)
MASWIPVNSSSLLRDRSCHSSALFLQASAVSAKNVWAADSDSSSASRFSVAIPRCSSSEAFSSSVLAFVFEYAAFCSVLVFMRVSYRCWLLASSAFIVSRFTTKVSYMSFKMPWTVADCGAYLILATWAMKEPGLLVRRAARSTTSATSIKEAPPVPAPDSTLMAFSRLPMADCISDVSPWNALFSFSRKVVACFIDSSFSAMSAASLAMSFSLVAMEAFNSKISLDRDAISFLLASISSFLR